jgi:antitoxin (DNA-binding transcriptional repressor) of toxin-antitoxin stability system
MREVALQEAKEHLSELIDAALAGETIMIVADGARAVQLTPARFGPGEPTFGSARGLFTVSDDFDAPVEEFDPLSAATPGQRYRSIGNHDRTRD